MAWLLRVLGTIEFMALAAVVMPREWMAFCHEWLGCGELPATPVFDSVMRQVSLFYALHGVALWLIASDVKRFQPLVILTGIGYLVAGPVFVWIDVRNAMPWPWLLGNGGSCLLIGLLVLGLSCRDLMSDEQISER